MNVFSCKASRILVLVLLFFLLRLPPVQAQHNVVLPSVEYQRTDDEIFLVARVYLSETFSLRDAEQAGVEIEHGIIKGTSFVQAVITRFTLNYLRAKGVRVDVVEPDAEAANRARIAADMLKRSKEPGKSQIAGAPRNFRLGSMAGFYTPDELFGEFNRMIQQFPDVVSLPEEIGRSVENRQLVAYRFGTAESRRRNAPEVLYTALHHAREPGSAATIIYFLWDLLERYALNDPEARYLLNNRQLYVIPMLNPDGYTWNFTSNPQGGGMWRKNRRRNSDGSFGVDLNRNYGTFEFWNAPNGGSALGPRSDTYRGTAPFSEPETAAIRDFCARHRFRTALNYHTFSNLLIYPYSFIDRESPDSTYYRAFAAAITSKNFYSGGRDLQTVGYAVRGASDDWMYAAVDGHEKILALTPEVGTVSDTFWPRVDRIAVHGAENLATNLTTAWSAGANIRLVQAYSNESPTTGRTRAVVEVQNLGVADAEQAAELQLVVLTRGVSIVNSRRMIPSLKAAAIQREIFELTVDSNTVAAMPNGTRINVEVLLLQDAVPKRDTVQMQIFQPQRVVLFNGDATNWQLGRWGAVLDPLSGKSVLTDSPAGVYLPNSTSFVTLTQPVDLRTARSATLEFQARWSLEANYDFAVVQISTDNGLTWRYCKSSRMRSGSGLEQSAQPDDAFGFDGNFPQWIRQECSLDEFIGSSILVRFGVMSEANGQFDGMYVSDVAIRVYDRDVLSAPNTALTGNALRLAPNVLSTENQFLVQVPATTQRTVELRILNVLGQQVFSLQSRTDDDGQLFVNNPWLPPGLYFVDIASEGLFTRQRLIVMR